MNSLNIMRNVLNYSAVMSAFKLTYPKKFTMSNISVFVSPFVVITRIKINLMSLYSGKSLSERNVKKNLNINSGVRSFFYMNFIKAS